MRRPRHLSWLVSTSRFGNRRCWHVSRFTYDGAMATLPEGRSARILLRVTCPKDHRITAYGVNEDTNWGPPGCVKCGGEMTAAEKIADLPHSPRHRYQVQLRSPTPEQAADWPYRQEVCADRFETTKTLSSSTRRPSCRQLPADDRAPAAHRLSTPPAAERAVAKRDVEPAPGCPPKAPRPPIAGPRALRRSGRGPGSARQALPPPRVSASTSAPRGECQFWRGSVAPSRSGKRGRPSSGSGSTGEA
jgi:hypothetical protein